MTDNESRIKRQHRFTVTPEHLILDPRVSDRAFRMWCRLDRFVGDREMAFPSNETLAIWLDCDPSSIARARKELVDAGWLLVEQRTGGTNLYTLVTAKVEITKKFIDAAIAEREKETEERREKKRQRRRAEKQTARATVKAAKTEENVQVSTGGVSTSEHPLESEGVSTGEYPPVSMGAHPGVSTGAHQKEATPEGSNTEGTNPSVVADAPPQEDEDSKVELTEQEMETGRDAAGNVLRGVKVKALSQAVTAAWWDWIEPNGHAKPAQSFLACRGIIRSALGNGIHPKIVKNALAQITKDGRPVTGAVLQIVIQEQTKGAGLKRGYDDVARWGNPDDAPPAVEMTEAELDAIFGGQRKKPGQSDADTA